MGDLLMSTEDTKDLIWAEVISYRNHDSTV